MPAPQPATPVDFRRVMSRVPAPGAIIAASTPDGPIGVSVGSFTSVSLEPPLVGFFIAEKSSTWPRLAAVGGFCASVLAADQVDTCRLFATPGADRFGATPWSSSPSGHPLIEGAVAWLDCELHAVHPAGDHSLVLGRVLAADGADLTPLIYFDGRYARVSEQSDESGWTA
jgi:flavin reductase (DIM6/NTAB) family NADH-FMN oxidoreductase RutF